MAPSSSVVLLFCCNVVCCAGFQASAPSYPLARSLALRRNAVVMEDKRYSDDVYNAASSQQIPTIKAVAGFAIVYIGGQLVLGEEGTLAFGRWLSEGPFGPIWNILSSPIVTRTDVADAAGITYDSQLQPTSGLFVIVAYNLVRAAQRRMRLSAVKSTQTAENEDTE